jgi:hypothetical protein
MLANYPLVYYTHLSNRDEDSKNLALDYNHGFENFENFQIIDLYNMVFPILSCKSIIL